MTLDSGTDCRVETYLDQVLAPLTRRLPDAERAELRRELRAHLWARLEAYRELGLTEEEAVAGALSQFGGADDFAWHWTWDWQRHSLLLFLRAICTAGGQALGLTFAGIAAALAPFCLIEWAYDRYYDTLLGHILGDDGWVFALVLVAFSFLFLPIVTGIKLGRRKVPYGNAALLAALVVETGLAFPLYQMLGAAQPHATIMGSIAGVLLALCLTWLPVAGIAAFISEGNARDQNGVRA